MKPKKLISKAERNKLLR
jgi:hypothetical protein